MYKLIFFYKFLIVVSLKFIFTRYQKSYKYTTYMHPNLKLIITLILFVFRIILYKNIGGRKTEKKKDSQSFIFKCNRLLYTKHHPLFNNFCYMNL